MKQNEWRLEVRLISNIALAHYMDHRGLSVRGLAVEVARITKGPCSPSTIGHLRSGKRASCRPATARAIEKALDAPSGSLFVPRVSNVVRDVAGRRSA